MINAKDDRAKVEKRKATGRRKEKGREKKLS
jgi:hypothetical protein